MLLAIDGHEVRVAYDGLAALEAAAAFTPEMILLDVGLPGMNGYEIARLLRTDGRLRGAYLIALTGYGQESDRMRATSAGFDLHLTKPVDPESLRTIVKEGRR